MDKDHDKQTELGDQLAPERKEKIRRVITEMGG